MARQPRFSPPTRSHHNQAKACAKRHQSETEREALDREALQNAVSPLWITLADSRPPSARPRSIMSTHHHSDPDTARFATLTIRASRAAPPLRLARPYVSEQQAASSPHTPKTPAQGTRATPWATGVELVCTGQRSSHPAFQEPTYVLCSNNHSYYFNASTRGAG